MLEHSARQKGLTLKLDIQGKLPQAVSGDPTRLRQVLLNIAGNAVKYSHPAGTVHLSCRELSAEADTAHFAFTCADTGVGMSKEFQQHAFEPFAQESANARTAYAGTGLGLAIAKQIVTAHGGEIHAENCSEGIRFEVKLPGDEL